MTVLIDEVRFDDLRYCRDSGRHSAAITLTARGRTLCLQGGVTASETVRGDDLSIALLRDAMRQVRRLPEFRCGLTRLEFRNDALHAIALVA